jgi:poly(A) polymerase
LDRLVRIDASSFFPVDPVLRLAAMLPQAAGGAEIVADRLKLSNESRKRLEDLAQPPERLVPYLSVREVHRLLYEFGQARFRDRVFLSWADDAKASNAISWRALLALADSWCCPQFPLTGRDVMTAGVPEGPQIGRILKEVESWWVDSDFTMDEFSLAERLKAIVQATAF